MRVCVYAINRDLTYKPSRIILKYIYYMNR